MALKITSSVIAVASAVDLTWSDCGDADTHAKITDLQPAHLELGAKTTLVGKGTLDKDENAGTFKFVAKTGPLPVLKGSGSLCEDTTINLPLGAGSIKFHALDCPVKAGEVAITLDVDILGQSSAEANALLDISLTAESDAGEKLICMDIKATDAVSESADDLGFNMHYNAPKDAGTYPVVLFVSGFSGDAPAFAYSKFVDGLVSHGFIVVGMDHLKFPDYPKQGQAFHDVMEWAAAGHLQEALTAAGISAVADLERVAVMGQSAGNHVVGQGLTDGCSLAKAMVMIDPVDGFDPFGIMHKEDLIHPGEKLTFTIPSLLLDNELDPKGKNILFPACAPAKLGAPRWFDATAGPVWNVNASSYGHLDCLDNLEIAVGKIVCPSDRKTDKKAYRTYLADTVALFLDGVLNGNTDKFSLLEDASKFNIKVTVRNDLKGQSHEDIKAGCSNAAMLV